MAKASDLIGQRFGKLTVLCRAENANQGRTQWLCKCDCGNEVVVRAERLKDGHKKSCGCISHTNKLPKDLTGLRFGMLLVEYKDSGTNTQNSMWMCQCDCGNRRLVDEKSLRYTKIRSCGCLSHSYGKFERKKHGMSGSPIYNTWARIKSRCYNENCADYANYGARGISMCHEWLSDFMSFYNWSMENGYEEGLSIDRIDVDGNYEPSNCRWTTAITQANNTTRNRYIEIHGIKRTLAEWCRHYNMSVSSIRKRIDKGIPDNELFYEIDTRYSRPQKLGD